MKIIGLFLFLLEFLSSVGTGACIIWEVLGSLVVFFSLFFFCLLSLKNIKISNFILVDSLKHFECNNLILDFQNMFSLILFL